MVGRIDKNKAQNQKYEDKSINELKKVSKRATESGLNKIQSTPASIKWERKHEFSKKIPDPKTSNKTEKIIKHYFNKRK